MQSTARRFDDVNASLDGMLRRLLNELEGLRTQWTGSGGRSFDQVKEAWAADQRKLHRALNETATAVRTAGEKYTTTDASAADRFSTRHVLPL